MLGPMINRVGEETEASSMDARRAADACDKSEDGSVAEDEDEHKYVCEQPSTSPSGSVNEIQIGAEPK